MSKPQNKEIDRFKALEVFSNIAKKYPVNKWQIDGVDIWPIFKILIVFEISSARFWNKKVSTSLLQRVVNKVSNILQKNKTKPIPSLKQTDILFFAARSHDVQYDNRLYNRFFEPLIENHPIHSTYLQYCNTENSEFDKRHFSQSAYLSSLKDITANYSVNEWWQLFLDLPNATDVIAWFEKELNYNESKIRKTINTCRTIANTAANIKHVLQQIKPKIVFVLNYYGPLGLAMVHAAKQLNIPSVDLQHGPQVMGNSGYANWEEIPVEGYNVLPDIFWNWDTLSQKNIDLWAKQTTAHRSLLGGNPWSDFWKKKLAGKELETETENRILYSLQPISTPRLFPEYLIDFIRAETQYSWTVRYHPRQSESQIQEIEKLLKQQGVFSLINFEDAVKTPLPLSIAKSKIGVTNYSGVAIELADFGKPSLIIHHLGEIAFSDLIEQGKAIYLNDKTELKSTIDRLIHHPTITNTSEGLSQKVFQALITQEKSLLDN